MARINGSGYKMKSSPAKGVLSNFFSSLGAKKTDMGELRSKQARSSKGTSEFEYRKTKEYKAEKDYKKRTSGVNPDNKTKMVNVVVDGVVKSVPAEDRFKYESVKRVKSTPKTEKTKKTEKPKKTKLSGSGTDARKKQYDAKGWKYDETIKGYNRDGTEIKKKKKKVDNKKIILQAIPRVNREENLIEDKKTTEEVVTKNKNDYNKTNDYSSSAVNKKSPSKKRGYKMKKR
tara:strand:+ start:123 stop:815 length:693 start_codon:yes stop_codon:yes gene_type:complete